MIIKAVKYFEKGFYAQGLAFGGEDGTEHFDNNVRYRGSLQTAQGEVQQSITL